jgi:hypothetical protein
MRRWALLIAVVLTSSIAVLAQLQTGTVMGTVTDQTGAVLPTAKVALESPISGHFNSTKTDDRGEFVFKNVPFDSYVLRVQADGFLPESRPISVRSNLPLKISLNLVVATAKESLTVKEVAGLVEEDSSSTETEVPEDAIRRSPGLVSSHPLQSLVATTPGWITENNGLMHIRGVDDGILYVLNGVPSPDRVDAVFAGPPDTGTLKSMDVITGNIPAEFGERTGAVVVMEPKSGINTPVSGTLSSGVGSFNAAELAATVGGGTKTIGGFLATSVSRSGRFLDPVDPRNFHNQGGGVDLFVRGDWHPTPEDVLLFSGGTDGSDFQVPNTLEQQLAGQRQRQELRDYNASLNWQHLWSADALSNLAYFRRFYRSELFGSPFDVPLSASQDRHLLRQGLLGSVSLSYHGHTLKAGAEADLINIQEFFTFFVTNQQAAAEADISAPALAFTAQNPFVFFDGRQRGLASCYVQDSFSPFKNLTVSGGLRYDHSNLLASTQQFSPRIGAVYYIKRTRTAVRASFNRLYMPPQVENLLLASSAQAQQLSPFAGNGTPGGATIFPERVSAWEAGFTQDARLARLNVAYWWKSFRNFDDPNVFFGTTIIFPNSVARGTAQGTDVRLDIPQRHGWSGYLNYSNSVIQQVGPINGGLFLTSDVLEIGPGTRFTPDHDQRNVGSFAVTYAHARSGLWTTFSGRYESGTPIDINPADLGQLQLQPGADLINLQTGRVKPWSIFGLSGGVDLRREARVAISAQLDAQNLFNKRFVYNFGNPFSGTHFGCPRLWSGRLKFTFR